jgi:predicted amidohydrolase YtcJ
MQSLENSKKQVISLDYQGAKVSTLSYSAVPQPYSSKWIQISELQPLRPANEQDFLSLPVLHEGFFDSHMHPSWMARLLSQIDLNQKTTEELNVEMGSTNKSVVYGFGWNEEFYGVGLDEITRYFDLVLPQDRKIYFFRKCGHSAYLSKAAKKKLKINHSQLIRDKEIAKIPEQNINVDEFIRNFKIVISNLKSEGISSACDLLVSNHDLQNLKSIMDSEFDIHYFQDIHSFNFFKNSPKKNNQYVKFFLDGSLGSQSAWLSQAYQDNPLNTGIQIWNDENLFQKAKQALEKNFLLAFHALGDGAIDQALRLGDALAPELKKLSAKSEGFFHRLEHLQVCRDDQIEKIKKQGFWSLGLQPSHRIADSSFTLKRLGEKRAMKESYRLKSFLNAGLRLSLGSDAPIVSFSPSKCINASTQDPRSCERLSLSQCFELMITQGRQNTGFDVKKLTRDSKAWLSNE